MASASARKTLQDIISANRRIVFEDVSVLQKMLDANIEKDGTEYTIPQFVLDAADISWWNLPSGHRCIVLLPAQESAPSTQRFVFYLHGGGFAIDMSDSHWDLVLALFDALHCPIAVPLYPLAPLHTSSEVYSCILEAYKQASARFDEMEPVLMGDSVGGHLAVALTQMIVQLGLKRPVMDILMSPWVDMSEQLPGKDELEKTDPMLARAGLNHIASLWCDDANARSSDTEGDCTEGSDPGFSEASMISTDLLDNGFEGFPPTYIFTGALEILSADSLALAKKLEKANVPVSLQIREGLWHTYPLFPEIDEAQETREEMAKLVQGAV